MYNENNFYISTKSNFVPVETPNRNPDYISYNIFGEVSSEYWYTKKGVIRRSGHWSEIGEKYFGTTDTNLVECGLIRTCWWTVRYFYGLKHPDITILTAYCPWRNFKQL